MSLFFAALTQEFWALTPKMLAAVADVARFSACACGSFAYCAAAPTLATATTVVSATAPAAATVLATAPATSTAPAPATAVAKTRSVGHEGLVSSWSLFSCETTRTRVIHTRVTIKMASRVTLLSQVLNR